MFRTWSTCRPFTLEGAEAVAGPFAGRALLRLVDCSLLVPPRVEPDGRSRYVMLETLRAYGAGLLIQAGEDREVAAAVAAYAVQLSEARQAATNADRGSGQPYVNSTPKTALLCALAWAMGATWSRCGWRSPRRRGWRLRGRP